MIGTKRIEEIISTVILSARVKGRKPLSIFLIAEPESGKTTIVTNAAEEQGEQSPIIQVTDVTGVGLQNLCQMHPNATHVVLNDLTIVSAHGQKTQQYLISMMNAMTEEGISNLYTPSGFRQITGGQKGIIACTTPGIVADGRRWWKKIGFDSRCLPVNFQYPEKLVYKIQDHQLFGFEQSKKPSKPVRVPKVSINVKMHRKYSDPILSMVRIKADEFSEQGIRKSEQFGTFVMAHSLMRSWRNPIVTEVDVNFLLESLAFMSWTKPVIL